MLSALPFRPTTLLYGAAYLHRPPALLTSEKTGVTPLDEHHHAEVHAVCSSIQTDDPPLWSGLLTPTARAAALRENRGHCLNLHEDTYSLKQCRHPVIHARGCLSPDLGQLGDGGEAYRRWQVRMIRYRREDKPPRSCLLYTSPSPRD